MPSENEESVSVSSAEGKPIFRNIAKRFQLASRLARAKRNELEEENDVIVDEQELKFIDRKASKVVRRQVSRKKTLTLRQLSRQISNGSSNKSSNHKINWPTLPQCSSIEEETVVAINEIISDGIIHFWKKSAYDEGHPYMRINCVTKECTDSSDVESAILVMLKCWFLELPKIACFIISNTSKSSDFTHFRQLKNFQSGLVKAAISTNMWIFTNGLNSKIAYAVGNAIRSETIKMKSKRTLNKQNLTNLIGVMREDQLVYPERLDAHDSEHIKIENEGINAGDKYELNPDHTHFVIVRDSNQNNDNLNSFMLRFLKRLTASIDISMETNLSQSTDESLKLPNDSTSFREIPTVSILIGGDSDSISFVLEVIKNRMPVVVFRGSGGLADLISLAYVEMSQRCRDIYRWDVEYVETHLKPLLSKKIIVWFNSLSENAMAVNLLRDRVVECVRLSRIESCSYLTILDIHNSSCNLDNLSEYLLMALLNSKHTNSLHSAEKFCTDLELTMDWNCAHVAENYLFSKNANTIAKLDKNTFESALIRADREKFIDLFLKLGFQVHKFLSPARLRRLFKLIHSKEFFLSVCWESILGHTGNAKQSKNFISNDLNWIIETCTGLENYVNVENLHLNIMGMYPQDSLAAERKALTILAFWAVMQNRHKLAQVLWKHSDQGVHLALVISMFYERLSLYCADSNQKSELKSRSKQFADYANELLDVCYKENCSRAYDVLSETIPEWNYMTAVDIAASAQLRQFIAHPCCQKWLTNTFLGKIRLREINWGLFTIPPSIKIVLCAFFIFPMYLWVHFRVKEEQPVIVYEEEFDENEENLMYEQKYQHENTVTSNNTTADHHTITGSAKHGFSNAAENIANTLDRLKQKRFYMHDREVFVRKQPPLWKMIILMWNSPISKFYIHQLFYILYLALLAVAVVFPTCEHHRKIDLAVCFWTAILVINNIRRAYILCKNYTAFPVMNKILEIVVLTVFVVLLLLTRGFDIHILNLYYEKVILAIGVLYFYYRFIAIYLPISPSLGPLLYRLKFMITVDFVNYMRITFLVIVSNGVVIQAILYPNSIIDLEMIRVMFHRAFFSLFTAPVEELQSKNRCESLYSDSCDENNTYHYSVDESCVTSGVWPYVFFVQYFILLKLILNSLLLAIFAARAAQLLPQTDLIWKYQRYQLVIDFANRLPLPAPLSVFWYIYRIIRCALCCFCDCNKKSNKFNVNTNNEYVKNYKLTEDDCNYWRQLAFEFIEQQESKVSSEALSKKEWQCMQKMNEDIEYEKHLLRELKYKLSELESVIVMAKSSSMSSMADSLHHSVQSIHSHSSLISTSLSRHSPYPGTQVIRVPVSDKYVAWQVMFIDYEPVTYSKPRNEFSSTLQEWVDDDLLLMKQLVLRNSSAKIKFPSYQWNSSAINPAGIAINRMSWHINDDGSALFYKLEDNLIPINPFGRTGLRGRGGFARWGPNHYVILIITRSKPRNQYELSRNELEFLLEKPDTNEQQLLLPERFIDGDDLFGEIKTLFKVDNNKRWVLPEVVTFFKQLCDNNEQHFKFELIKYGFIDDPMNTDNAWKEAKVWHIHYSCAESVKRVISDCHATTRLSWHSLSQISLCAKNMPLGHNHLIRFVTDNINNNNINTEKF